MLTTLSWHLCTSRGNQHMCDRLSTQTMTNHVRGQGVWHGSMAELCRLWATDSTSPQPQTACSRPTQSLALSSSEPQPPLMSALFFSSHVCPRTWHLSLHQLPLGLMDGQGTWQNSLLFRGISDTVLKTAFFSSFSFLKVNGKLKCLISGVHLLHQGSLFPHMLMSRVTCWDLLTLNQLWTTASASTPM